MREYEAFLETPLNLPLYQYKNHTKTYWLSLVILAIITLTIPHLVKMPILEEIFHRKIDLEVFSFFFDFRGTFILVWVLVLGRVTGLAVTVISTILIMYPYLQSLHGFYYAIESMLIQLIAIALIVPFMNAYHCDTWLSSLGFTITFNLAFHVTNITALFNTPFTVADSLLILINWCIGAVIVYFSRAHYTAIPAAAHQKEMEAKWDNIMVKND